ncbi:MAG: helix-turn-helix transcriptional regulator [Gaiellaceae bacterium]
MDEREVELITGAEIARGLGVTRERGRQLAERPDFPKPLGRLGTAHIWAWKDVEEWWLANERPPPVEIWSWTDDPVSPDPQVWYQTTFGETKYERTTDYKTALELAERLAAKFDSGIIDRSDKGNGFLKATLGRSPQRRSQ